MTKKELDQFGKKIIERVLDISIDKYKMVKAGEIKSKSALRMSALINEFDAAQRRKIDRIVSDSMEVMLHKILFFFEDNEEWAIVQKEVAAKKKIIHLADFSDGLSGEIYGTNGWIEKYSSYK